MMTAVFAAQGWGQLSAALVALVVVAAFKGKIIADPPYYAYHVDFCWRLLIGLGAIPAVIALYFRLTLPETPRFTMDVEASIKQAAADVDAFLTTQQFVRPPSRSSRAALMCHRCTTTLLLRCAPRYPRRAVAITCSTLESGRTGRFCLAARGPGSRLTSPSTASDSTPGPSRSPRGERIDPASIILQAIGFGTPLTGSGGQKRYQTLKNISVGNIVLSLAGLIPGYWVAFLFIDSWGRKPIQLMGFIILTITLSCMGFGYRALVSHATGAFVFLFCLTNFFQNFGPNTTTSVFLRHLSPLTRRRFVIPGEIFPTRYRSTAHGISAASGKFGAIIAQIMAFRLKDIGGKNNWINHILEIFALFMFTGSSSPAHRRLLTRRRDLLDAPHPRDQGQDARGALWGIARKFRSWSSSYDSTRLSESSTTVAL